MININEFRDYCKANKKLIDLLRSKESIVYDRLSDVFKVLGHIELLIDKYQNIEEEYDTFYEVGFPFLYKQFEEIKIYFNHYFKKNYQEFKNFEPLINYILYLDDLKDTLKEEGLLNERIIKAIDSIDEEIEQILTTKSSYSDEVFDRFNAIIASEIVFKRRVLTTTEIFERIVEELVIQ